MADVVTLAILRARAKAAANMENSGFVTDSEWNYYLNYGARRLYDLLVSKFGDEYYLKSYTFSVVAGTDSYDLPSDFYRERAVDLNLQPKPVSMSRFNFRDRNKYNWAQINWGTLGATPLYSLVGTQIRFMPTPVVAQSVTLWYIPTLQVLPNASSTWTSQSLSNDGDRIDGVCGYEQFVVLEAAILATIKEQTDPSALIAMRAEVKDWIESAAAQRNAGDPNFVGDASPDNGPFGSGPWNLG